MLQTVSIKVYSIIPFSRNLRNTETSQLIWNADNLTDFYILQETPKGISEQAIITCPLPTSFCNIIIIIIIIIIITITIII